MSDPERARRGRWAEEWRRRASDALESAAEAFPAPDDGKIPWEDHVDVDYWAWKSASEHPDQLDLPAQGDEPPDPYVDSVGRTSRRVGLATLRAWLAGAGPDLTAVARQVVEDRLDPHHHPDDLAGSLRVWIDGLDATVRAAVVAEAATYALRAVRVGVGRGQHVYAPGSSTLRWRAPASRLRLTARAEVASNRTPKAADLRLLVLDTSSPTPGRAESLAGWVALCHTLFWRMVPVSVTVRNLRTGQPHRAEVDDHLLGVALEQASFTAGLVAASSVSPPV